VARVIRGLRTYNYTLVETKSGWVAIAGQDGRISAIETPAADKDEALRKLRAGIDGQLVESNDGLEQLARQIRDYFDGAKVEFTFEPDLDGLTEFQRKILRTTMTVPHGVVVTYKWLAQEAGYPGAHRAAGQALGRNPIPIAIPCHRVIASSGGLGGFSGGLHCKKELLALEGVEL
jgi:methylated-DNA-[protein]-cysteine S-methyltransferase